jgi:hypothetical protein
MHAFSIQYLNGLITRLDLYTFSGYRNGISTVQYITGAQVMAYSLFVRI